jgi:hypothetical protein
MLVKPIGQVSRRRVAGSRIAGIGGPWRSRSQVGWPGIHGARGPLRIRGQGRMGLRLRVWVWRRLGRRVGMPLGRRIRMPLVLRTRRLLVGRSGMGLCGRMRGRRRRMRGTVLSAHRQRDQRQGSERGSQCCAAPSLRPGCALHLFPDLTVSEFRKLPWVSNGDPGAFISWYSNRHPTDLWSWCRISTQADPAVARCCPASANHPPPPPRAKAPSAAPSC